MSENNTPTEQPKIGAGQAVPPEPRQKKSFFALLAGVVVVAAVLKRGK